ncbi:MAG: hypothetical protein JNL83_21685 [Myxococcales bacterium]|nr:hypothetical protein [Myxococcales bacterium]
MNTMASVGKSSPADARSLCPQCGGFVHPIAGKCKHCKADLAAARGARPAAAAVLPALANGGTNKPLVKRDEPPLPTTLANAAAAAESGHHLILPQRHTGGMSAQHPPSRSLLKNWPVLVIILAGIAIAAAVVLMVLPESKDAKADTRIPPPPAPERMDTNPLPPQGSMITPPSPAAPSPDPWSQPAPPDPQAQIDPDDPTKDPFANPNARRADPLSGLGFNSRGSAVMVGVFQHACSRLAACGNASAGLMCSSMTQLFGNTQVPTCASAQRCFDQIDQLDCGKDLSSQSDVLSAMTTVKDCVEAMTSC